MTTPTAVRGRGEGVPQGGRAAANNDPAPAVGRGKKSRPRKDGVGRNGHWVHCTYCPNRFTSPFLCTCPILQWWPHKNAVIHHYDKIVMSLSSEWKISCLNASSQLADRVHVKFWYVQVPSLRISSTQGWGHNLKVYSNQNGKVFKTQFDHRCVKNKC